jgi:hypothetical protein
MRGPSGFYRAESVPMIHNLYEFQREGRDADEWLWDQWLSPAGHLVDIRPWLLRRLDHVLKAIKAIGEDADEVERQLGGLKRGRLGRKLQWRGITRSELRDLALWAYRVAADIEQHERLDNPDSRILVTLRQFAGLPHKGFPAPDKKLGVESMSFAWLHEFIQQVGPDALEQLRRDCQAIDHLAKLAARIDWRAAQSAMEPAVRSVIGGMRQPPSVQARKKARKRPPVPTIVRVLIAMWEEADARAGLACGLIAFRQSPEHGKRITEILALTTWMLELASQLPVSSR